METLSEYYNYSLLAQASYADDLSAGMFGTQAYELLLSQTERNPLAELQAEDFAFKYQVLAHQENTFSGFSATTFEDVSGIKYIAIRGTENLTDWQTNIADIGEDGIAVEQGIAMMNWMQELYSAEGQSYIQYTYKKRGQIYFLQVKVHK